MFKACFMYIIKPSAAKTFARNSYAPAVQCVKHSKRVRGDVVWAPLPADNQSMQVRTRCAGAAGAAVAAARRRRHPSIKHFVPYQFV